MIPRRPEVFVSATSADLRSCRQLVKEGLLTLGCVPVEQANFPPDYRHVRDMLRSKIAGCDAVIHLVGECYGAEPGVERGRTMPRRSYTQLEYDIARELRKPLYVFLCDSSFAYDNHETEDLEKQRLQNGHRAAVAAGDLLRCEVGSHADLAIRVRELQTSVEDLKRELTKARSWLRRGVAVSVVLLAILGSGLWLLNDRAGKTEQRVAGLETEIERHRRYVAAVFEAYEQQPAPADRAPLAAAERMDRAVTTVADREAVSSAVVRSVIYAYVVAVRTSPNASARDRGLADFAERSLGLRRTAPPRDSVGETSASTESHTAHSRVGSAVGAVVGSIKRSQTVSGVSDLDTAGDRIKARVPAILLLKHRHVVGENNRGFLERRGEVTTDEAATIFSENEDRAFVYESLGSRLGSTAEETGRVRAKQIAGIAHRGHWIQSASGVWTQKP